MKIIWPMGCKKTPDLGKVEALLKNDNYVAQQKIDGVRGILQFDEQGNSHITTRGASLEDPETPLEITHRLPQLQMKVPQLAGTVLDGEIWVPHLTSAQIAGMVNFKSTVPVDPEISFYCFDILYLKSHKAYDKPLKSRLDWLDSIKTIFMIKERLILVPYFYTTEGKTNLLQMELEAGREGIVLKNLYSDYVLGTAERTPKPVNHWYKVKKKDTVDVIITGSEPPEKYYRNSYDGKYDLDRLTKPWKKGWFGSITFKFKNGANTGSCSGISDYMKEHLSDGQHNILHNYIGRTMEVEYMEKTTDGNLRHPRFVRIREEIEK